MRSKHLFFRDEILRSCIWEWLRSPSGFSRRFLTVHLGACVTAHVSYSRVSSISTHTCFICLVQECSNILGDRFHRLPSMNESGRLNLLWSLHPYPNTYSILEKKMLPIKCEGKGYDFFLFLKNGLLRLSVF